jgi:hypothetical protein
VQQARYTINPAIKQTSQQRPSGRDIAPKDGAPATGVLLTVTNKFRICYE